MNKGILWVLLIISLIGNLLFTSVAVWKIKDWGGLTWLSVKYDKYSGSTEDIKTGDPYIVAGRKV
jgi:hypothetical protein